MSCLNGVFQKKPSAKVAKFISFSLGYLFNIIGQLGWPMIFVGFY